MIVCLQECELALFKKWLKREGGLFAFVTLPTCRAQLCKEFCLYYKVPHRITAFYNYFKIGKDNAR